MLVMNSATKEAPLPKGKNTLRHDWLWSFGADMLARLGAIVVILYYFTFLGREAAGVIIVSYSYVIMCWLLVDLGLGAYGARQVALEGADVRRMQEEITSVRLMLSLVASALAAVLVTVMADASLSIALGFAVFLIFRGLSLDWFFKGLARFKLLAGVNISAAIAQMMVIPFINDDNWPQLAAVPFAVWAIVLAAVGWFATGGSAIKMLASTTIRNLRHLKQSLGFSLANGVSTIFQQLPIVSLSFVFAPAQIVGFGLMHRICMASMILFYAFGSAIYPRLISGVQKSMKGAQEMTVQATAIIGLLALAPAAGIAGGFAIPILRETYFANLSWIACLALISFLVIRSMTVAPMRLLFAANEQKRAVIASLISIFFYISSIIILYASNSVSISTISVFFAISEFISLIYLCTICRKIF